MLILISPAKTLDYKSTLPTDQYSEPAFLTQSAELIELLRKKSPKQLCKLMHISDKLGELNHERYQSWHTPFNPDNARPALFAFKGDVYLGLKAEQFNQQDLKFAQQHLRILSGLYGVLRPLDLMQPYRLEMGTALKNKRGKDLYRFWKSTVTQALAESLAAEKKPLLINLASHEYFSAVDSDMLDAEIITPQFKDFSNGQYRLVSFFAKTARGLMAAWIIKQRLNNATQLKDFAAEGYRYSEADSSPSVPVFLRKKVS